MARFDLARRIADVVAIDPTANAIEFAGRWYTWGELGATVDAVAREIPPGAEVAVLLRNRPSYVVFPERGTKPGLHYLLPLGPNAAGGAL